MKIEKLNPFRGIIETDYSPHARTLRTGFIQKMRDVFCVFVGSLRGVAGTPSEEHVGFLDFCFGPFGFITYPLHRNFWKWFNRADIDGQQGSTEFQEGLLLFLGIFFNLPKYIIAAVLTLSIFLVVGVVQVIVCAVNYRNDREDIYNLEVSSNTRANGEDHPEDGPLRDILGDNKDLNTLTLTNIQPIPRDDHHPHETVQFTFSQNLVSDKLQKDIATYTAVFPVPVGNSPEKVALDAMLDLNIGGITKQLEQQKKNHQPNEPVPLMTALGYP